MKEKTINGREVFIFTLSDGYLVLKDGHFYFTKERPVTDQEINVLENELYITRQLVNNLSHMTSRYL